MNKSNPAVQAATAFALVLACGLSMAQSLKSTCMNVGAGTVEPVGDREGHALQVSEGTCMSEGGLLDGAVMTQNTIWEHDKGGSTILSADGVARKPGAIAAYRLTAGSLNMLMQDGKPAGWTASGKGVYTAAGGSAAALAGKTFSWTARATGPRSYAIETKLD